MERKRKVYSHEELELLADERYLEIERLEEEARKAAAADEFWDFDHTEKTISGKEPVKEKSKSKPGLNPRRNSRPNPRPKKGTEEQPKKTERSVEVPREKPIPRKDELRGKSKAGRRTKERTPISQRFIKRVGTLLGVVIVFLVVLVIFGGDLIAGIFGNSKLASKEGVINILLVGQDAREEVEGSRSDSMMLVSVNNDTDQVKIVSLMRDMYVSIPGHEDNRINASYSLGGVDLLKKTVEKNFGVKIDGNVQIDFESFKTVVDAIGGVEIELSREEADYLNLAYWQYGWTLTEGVQTLTGDQALAYSRVRQVGNSDFERTERQRTVLMTAFRKVKAQGKIKMLSLAKDIYPMLETDIELKDMVNLGMTALSLKDDSITTYRLPVDGGYKNETIRDMAVLVPDLEMNRNYLTELLFGTVPAKE